jgi:hypothetical protein
MGSKISKKGESLIPAMFSIKFLRFFNSSPSNSNPIKYLHK